jgi:hypothetical protein
MSFSYSGKPFSNDEKIARLVWENSERYEIGKVVIITSLVLIPLNWFFFHLGWVLFIIAIFLLNFSVAKVMTKAQNEAWKRYWNYWQSHDF